MSSSVSIPLTSRRAIDWSGATSVSARRKAQVALGIVWLIDAALQYQPYMFRREFVTQTLETASTGAPYLVAHPALWVDHLLLHHIAGYNAVFATVQLLIALALFYRPTVRAGLFLSVVWAVSVWWLAEGIGAVTDGASPLNGAPGAVILYALVALLVWPPSSTESAPSVAEGGALGSLAARLAWTALWGGFIALGLEAANRSPSAMHDLVAGAGSGEPGWLQALDRGLAGPLAHHGTEVSIALAVLDGVAALGAWVPAARRPALIVAVALGVAIWLAEDFGGIFTGSGTDVNSGPLIVLLAATFWPLRRQYAP